MTLACFDGHIRRLFAGTRSAAWRVGAEVELIVLPRSPLQPLAVGEEPGRISLLRVVRQLACERRWRETVSPYGVPGFILPGVGVLSFEPGGQLELSTRPFSSPSLLLAAIRGVIAPIRAHAGGNGLDVLEIGFDPANDVRTVPLAFQVERYIRMAAYFDSLGGDGVRMMKQSASFQVSLDVRPEDAAEVWLALNAIVPFCIAAFANSPQASGVATGDASARARVWQRTDLARTGIFTPAEDPAAAYGEFALDAPAFLLDGAAAPLAEHLARGAVTEAEWRRHLTTLFPEVRPRGHFEFRACDAVGDDARAALLALLCAMARDRDARAAILEITGPPDRGRYAAAPAAPVALLSGAADALAIALRSARDEPRGLWLDEDLDGAERFVCNYTARGLTPASDWSAPLQLTA